MTIEVNDIVSRLEAISQSLLNDDADEGDISLDIDMLVSEIEDGVLVDVNCTLELSGEVAIKPLYNRDESELTLDT